MTTNVYLDRLSRLIDTARDEAARWGHLLVKAYAEHEPGTSYEYCDSILSYATHWQDRYEKLKEAYSKKCDLLFV